LGASFWSSPGKTVYSRFLNVLFGTFTWETLRWIVLGCDGDEGARGLSILVFVEHAGHGCLKMNEYYGGFWGLAPAIPQTGTQGMSSTEQKKMQR
jgi:hypothetical protein